MTASERPDDRLTMSDLNGATRVGEPMTYPADPGEFAARWNTWSEKVRAEWLERRIAKSQAAADLDDSRLEVATLQAENAKLLTAGESHRRSNRKWYALQRERDAALNVIAKVRDWIEEVYEADQPVQLDGLVDLLNDSMHRKGGRTVFTSAPVTKHPTESS